MGTTSFDGNSWFDYEGSAKFYKQLPLLCTKKAIFKRNGLVHNLMKLVLNATVFNFKETAEGGVVICAPNFTTISFVSPDNRLDYLSYHNMTLGEALDAIEAVITENPIQAWDKFTNWIGTNGDKLKDMTSNIATSELTNVEETSTVTVGTPVFTEITTMVSFIQMLKTQFEPALTQPMTNYMLDDKAIGCTLKMTTNPDDKGTVTVLQMAYIFRE